MSAILKFDFQKGKQLRFSEVNYLTYTKKDPIFHVTTKFSLKQGETRTSSIPIPHPLSTLKKQVFSCLSSIVLPTWCILTIAFTNVSFMKFLAYALFLDLLDNESLISVFNVSFSLFLHRFFFKDIPY